MHAEEAVACSAQASPRRDSGFWAAIVREQPAMDQSIKQHFKSIVGVSADAPLDLAQTPPLDEAAFMQHNSLPAAVEQMYVAGIRTYHALTNGRTVDGKGFAGCAIASKAADALARALA